MKFLHTADLHLGRFLENRSRAGEQEEMLAEIAALAEAEAVDLALLAGDIFDSFIPPAWAEALFYDFLIRLSKGGQRPVVVIAGNFGDRFGQSFIELGPVKFFLKGK